MNSLSTVWRGDYSTRKAEQSFLVFNNLEIERERERDRGENGRAGQLPDAFLHPSHPQQKGREQTPPRAGRVLLQDGVLEDIRGDERRRPESSRGVARTPPGGDQELRLGLGTQRRYRAEGSGRLQAGEGRRGCVRRARRERAGGDRPGVRGCRKRKK